MAGNPVFKSYKKPLSALRADRGFLPVRSNYKTGALPAASRPKRQNHESREPPAVHAGWRGTPVSKMRQITGNRTAEDPHRRTSGAGGVWGSCSLPDPAPTYAGCMPKSHKMRHLRRSPGNYRQSPVPPEWPVPYPRVPGGWSFPCE